MTSPVFATGAIACFSARIVIGTPGDSPATTAGSAAVHSAAGPTVHSMDESKKRNPAASTKTCFTYLCLKSTGRRKMLFSKEMNFSRRPTKKDKRLDKTFPFRRRAGKINALIVCQVKNTISTNSRRISTSNKMTLCDISDIFLIVRTAGL